MKTLKQKWTDNYDPYKLYPAHEAKNNSGFGFCGYYWHSRRLAKRGTDWIFDEGRKQFQLKCKDNKCEWGDVREILFQLKKYIDQCNRNMMWHFRERNCEKCEYWDDFYKKHVANVEHNSKSQEVTDEEMLAAAMEVDGSDS